MAGAFDNRLIQVSLAIAGQTVTFDQEYYIVATGRRFASSTFAECTLRIDNISKADRDYIISKVTLWNKNHSPVALTLSVGRESYGTFVLFDGAVVLANVSQPPDIGLTLTANLTAAQIGYSAAFYAPPQTTLLALAQAVTDNLSAVSDKPYALDFESAQGNKQIANFNFTGPVTNQIQKLSELASITVYPENNKLIVRDVGVPRQTPAITISSATGMVGVPEITDLGLRVKMLIRNDIELGTPVNVESVMNPLANGTYYVYGLAFEVASREPAFYWVMDLTPPDFAIGYTQ